MLIGHAGAVALSRIMGTIIFRVSPFDPTVLLGAIVFMALVGAVAAYCQHAAPLRTVLQGV
jgi:hypothetical protein